MSILSPRKVLQPNKNQFRSVRALLCEHRLPVYFWYLAGRNIYVHSTEYWPSDPNLTIANAAFCLHPHGPYRKNRQEAFYQERRRHG